ncbi:hypothetical protein T07_8251 [Trichinella nelsoni]|uniref:Uncharacterized protein n=1 Tax=Trichinella nelsoni TaxID=6336 RepID=A0A0V0RH33_9BILA|nr:hypothetical protein T07_8251 [Trichinella nelsoni]
MLLLGYIVKGDNNEIHALMILLKPYALSPSNCLPNWISVFKNQKKYIILLKLSIFNFYKEKMSPVDTARLMLTQQEIIGTPLVVLKMCAACGYNNVKPYPGLNETLILKELLMNVI